MINFNNIIPMWLHKLLLTKTSDKAYDEYKRTRTSKTNDNVDINAIGNAIYQNRNSQSVYVSPSGSETIL